MRRLRPSSEAETVALFLRTELVALEGHARLTAFMLARDRLPPELEVLVGSSRAMIRWGCW
jgi:hypothetical protein